MDSEKINKMDTWKTNQDLFAQIGLSIMSFLPMPQQDVHVRLPRTTVA